LRQRVPLQRIEFCWASLHDGEQARAKLEALRARVAHLPRETSLEEDSLEQELKPGEQN